MFFVNPIILQFPITEKIIRHRVKNVTQNLQTKNLTINKYVSSGLINNY